MSPPGAARATSRSSRGSDASTRAQWAQTYAARDYRDLPWFHTFAEPFIERSTQGGTFPPGTRWLDVGCGAGTNALWLAERGFRAVGVDLAPGAVAAAGRRRKARKETRASGFVTGDALALPFRNGSFGAGSDIGCFHTLPIPRREEYAHELSRVLAPGALYLMSWIAREETAEMGPPHRPSVLEVAEAMETHFLLRSVEFEERSRRGSSLHAYNARLERRKEPQPPPR